MRRIVPLLGGLLAVIALVPASPQAAAQADDDLLPPNWSGYDSDGNGTLSDAECAALSDGQAAELRQWINVPNESGLFDSLPDLEARRWAENHFETVRYRLQDDSYRDHPEDCGRVMDDLPGEGCGYTDPGCTVDAVQGVAGDVANNLNPLNAIKKGFEKVAEQFAEAYESLLETATTFWMEVPSTSGQSDQTMTWLQDNALMRSLTGLVGIVGWTIAMCRLALSARGEELRQSAFGLLRMAIVGAAGIWFVQLALQVGDEWSRDLVSEATTGAPSEGLKTLLATSPGLMFMLAIVGIITSLLQIVILIFRNVGTIVMAGAWQVTAAASVSGDSTLWRRTTAWLAALILYKPAAAIVYAAGFRLLHEDQSYAGEILAAIQGMVLLGLAVLVLPAMVRLVMPAASMGGPSTAGVLAAGAGAVATGAMISSGSLSSLLGAGSGAGSGSGGESGGGASGNGDAASALPSGSASTAALAGGAGDSASGGGAGGGGEAAGAVGATGAAAGGAAASGSGGAAGGGASPAGLVVAGAGAAARGVQAAAEGLSDGPAGASSSGSGSSSSGTAMPPPTPAAESPAPRRSGPEGSASSLPDEPEGQE